MKRGNNLAPIDVSAIPETIFEKPSRVFINDAQKAAWETAHAFGFATLLNTCSDAAFDRFVTGVQTAAAYLKTNAVNLSAVDYGAYMLAAVKTALACDAGLYEAAYTDMLKALNKNDKKTYDAPDVRTYFTAVDAKAKEEKDFTTTRYAYAPDETVKRLQEALALAGCNDMFGEKLLVDGVFGPKTYYAALDLAQR